MLVERPLWPLYAEGVLWARNVRQKTPWTLCALWEKKLPMNKRMHQKGSVKSVSSVRDNTSQWFAWVSSHSEGAYFFSQNNTDEQNTQHFTETLSQPISQSVTATFSYNVLWILYAGGLLWVRNVGWNVLLNLWVLWEKKLPSVLFVYHLIEWVRSISHRRTQINRTHSIPQRH